MIIKSISTPLINKFTQLSLLIGLSLPIQTAVAQQTATLVESGSITCFGEGLTDENDELIPAGASAAVYDPENENLYVALDRQIPLMMRSPVFSLKYPTSNGSIADEKLKFLLSKPFKEAIKFEASTITPNGKHIIITTPFGEIGKTENVMPDKHPYNTIVCFPVDDPSQVTVAHATTVDGHTSSISLRNSMLAVLRTMDHPEGVPYYSIEGLAAIPGNRLLFGIRQIGRNYTDCMDVNIILSVPYQIIGNELHIEDNKFEVVFNWDLSTIPEVGCTVGISSLEYDKYNNRLYMLTTYERTDHGHGTDQDVKTFIWTMPLDDLYLQKMPKLVRQEDGTPFTFAHKMEGLAVINKNRIVVVADDDLIVGRKHVENPDTEFSRKLNEAAYAVLDIKD